MLIGDLSDDGRTSWLPTLISRIDVAAQSGVDVIILNTSTSSFVKSYGEADRLIDLAAEKGISVIADIKVNTASSSEFIQTFGSSVSAQPDAIPDYTNQAQLKSATGSLEEAIRHFEGFPNIVAYKIEWGHWNESWINTPFWDSPSSKAAFLTYLKGLSPQFNRFDESNLSNWVIGDAMYNGPCLPASDVRHDPLNVAEFNWYQQWRNEMTQEITWHFRSAAKALTTKPIAGFSYVVAGFGALGFPYRANKYLDIAFSDWASHPNSYQKDFIRDAYFPGLHVGELDFDTPYFSRDRMEQAVQSMYDRGIIPQIFYPQWSKGLSDSDIPKLVEYINKYKETGKTINRAQVLVVFGHLDVGLTSLTDTTSLSAEGGAPLTADDPPGLLEAIISKGITVDVVDPDVYTPALGDQYKVVLAVVPRDSVDHAFQNLLSQTGTNVIIAQPSFLFGTPTQSSPTTVTAAYCGQWNPLVIKGRTIKTQVYGTGGSNPQIEFQGPYSSFGTINNYTAHHIFAYYDGNFDEVYATAHFPNVSFPTVVRIGNIVLFGLDTHLDDAGQRQVSQSAFLKLLENMGVKY
jgi:hypothetical protein